MTDQAKQPFVECIIFDGEYEVKVKNDKEKEESWLSIHEWALAFKSKQAVENHIAILQKALEFMEYGYD